MKDTHSSIRQAAVIHALILVPPSSPPIVYNTKCSVKKITPSGDIQSYIVLISTLKQQINLQKEKHKKLEAVC
ncbi:hypothetical protein EB796_023137 [Bugula neritina]|uniref:Uncharacterized protein n=1 Tax=Bugula neritina TaxID=10212 RepID=A0A7J7IYC2_BUGNE|nr:hypothetical protein EB796_023137 [Bugula neritina]